MREKVYQVLIGKRTEKSVDRLPKKIRLRIRKAMRDLEANPRPRGWELLEGKRNICRIWVGRRYRVVYKIDDKKKTIVVIKAATREGVY